jgi:diacylglycerol kinase (ATP)
LKSKPLYRRIGFALAGLRVAWQGEPSLRAQVGLALAALLVLVVLRPALLWWALMGAMVALVLAAELLNTAMEHLVDHLHPEQHPRIKVVKDCAAAAVLVLSLGALWVGILMLLASLKP